MFPADAAYTVSAAAAKLGKSPWFVYRRIRAGKLEASDIAEHDPDSTRPRAEYLITGAALNRLIEAGRRRATEPKRRRVRVANVLESAKEFFA